MYLKENYKRFNDLHTLTKNVVNKLTNESTFNKVLYLSLKNYCLKEYFKVISDDYKKDYYYTLVKDDSIFKGVKDDSIKTIVNDSLKIIFKISERVYDYGLYNPQTKAIIIYLNISQIYERFIDYAQSERLELTETNIDEIIYEFDSEENLITDNEHNEIIETIYHELVHFYDDVVSKGRVFSGVKPNLSRNAYVNQKHELNAFFAESLKTRPIINLVKSLIKSVNQNNNMIDVSDFISKYKSINKDFFDMLTDKNKKRIFRRLSNIYYEILDEYENEEYNKKLMTNESSDFYSDDEEYDDYVQRIDIDKVNENDNLEIQRLDGITYVYWGYKRDKQKNVNISHVFSTPENTFYQDTIEDYKNYIDDGGYIESFPVKPMKIKGWSIDKKINLLIRRESVFDEFETIYDELLEDSEILYMNSIVSLYDLEDFLNNYYANKGYDDDAIKELVQRLNDKAIKVDDVFPKHDRNEIENKIINDLEIIEDFFNENDFYTLHDMNHRFKAVKELGVEEVLVEVD